MTARQESDDTSRRLRIDWIAEGVSSDGDGVFRSELASNRYRAAMPAGWLRGNGHHVQFVPQHRWKVDPSCLPDAVIVAKLPPLGGDAQIRQSVGERVLDQVRAARSMGVTALADFNDDHFDHPTLGPYWRRLAREVDVCVVGSEAMGEALRRHSDRPIREIGDPIGSPRMTPRVFRKRSNLPGFLDRIMPKERPSRLQLVWYGDGQNWSAMADWAQQIAPLAAEQPFVLWIVTRKQAVVDTAVADFNRRFGPSALMELVAWDEETQWSIVRDADVVLIPADLSNRTKLVKTSNRLTDALHAGRFVIASPVPSYLPYADFAQLTEAPLSALQAYVRQPHKALEKVRNGQLAALEQCVPDKIGRLWEAALIEALALERRLDDERTTEESSLPGGAPAIPTVRLNLGCGDKILPGYVNVDVVESRAGKRPDVICDLHALTPFETDSVDEVLAVHVVEHFWRWEIEAVLREWVRVLRPGGRMVLECPNLQSACEAFLADPVAAAQPGRSGQRAMWVFYGDPQWKDPLMMHRWGYTPSSLGELMESVGLVDARQEPAQFKLREPRDMRVVADKPRS